MKKIFLLAGLIVVLAAFWASSHPDGLNKVAETLGFAGKAVEHQTLMTGYSLPFLPAGPASTAATGVIGVLFLFGLFSGVRLFFSKK
ncbi:MAG: PDGLE domain-containing protein [Candidatus Margulisbacteria bacterium]|nr:PDGLE domain-containing protein [Candidatus Margulisiibacteriota bacterium]